MIVKNKPKDNFSSKVCCFTCSQQTPDESYSLWNSSIINLYATWDKIVITRIAFIPLSVYPLIWKKRF